MLTFLLSKDLTVPRPEDALLSIPTASAILECSDRFTFSLGERGEVEIVWTGRYRKVTLSSINAYIARAKDAARAKIEAAIDAEPPPPPRRGRPRKRPVRANGEGAEK